MKADDEGLRIAQEVEVALHEKALYDSDPHVRFKILRAELHQALKRSLSSVNPTESHREIYLKCIRMARVCRNLLAEDENSSDSMSSAGH